MIRCEIFQLRPRSRVCVTLLPVLFHYRTPCSAPFSLGSLAGSERRAYWEAIVTAFLTSSISYCTGKKKGKGNHAPWDLMPHASASGGTR